MAVGHANFWGTIYVVSCATNYVAIYVEYYVDTMFSAF